jgi:hypothetical protein
LSRDNPSGRYRELLSMYKRLHSEGEPFQKLPPESTYPGVSILPHIDRIRGLIQATQSKTILDYGCGKGLQYEPRRIKIEGIGEWDSLMDYWDVDEVRCYDPCYTPYSTLPTEQFDGVISTDVLEHCVEEDLPWIVNEIFSFATKFVFASIACYPAKSRLPNGENAHCTVKPPQWWDELFRRTAAQHPDVRYETSLIEIGSGARGAAQS